MNFFEHQDDARRNTKKLVFLFIAAVLALLVITNLTVAAVMWSFDSGIFQQQAAYNQSVADGNLHPEMVDSFITYLSPERMALISVAVVGTILLVIFLKRLGLSGGGKRVAESLGAVKIKQNTDNLDEQKILNVVEEMALASGLPVPPVYILEEAGINAFAAGFSASDAVIGISRGSIQQLNRDQLQGVVAHEFSHVLNGDMRLNLNLIAVLAGILFIGHAGWFIVRAFGYSRYRRSSSSRDSGSALVFAGFALVVVGFIGAFFGNLIKAAVSRQREFLADASAVQFTRNPEGIAGALKMIGGSVYGSQLEANHAEEMSHLFFGNALPSKSLSASFSSLFATHPPLEERISRIDPHWDGRFMKAAPVKTQSSESASGHHSAAGVMGLAAGSAGALGGAARVGGNKSVLSASIEKVGEPDEQSVRHVHEWLEVLDPKIKQAAKSPDSARAIVYLLLLNTDKKSRQTQWKYLQAEEIRSVAESMVSLLKGVEEHGKEHRLDLIELLVPALKEMTADEYKLFLKHIVFLVKADGQIELFEWLLHTLLLHYLKPTFEKVPPVTAKYRQLKKLRNECRFLLSHLTYIGNEAGQQQLDIVFDKGFGQLDLGGSTLMNKSDLNLQDVNNAIFHFSRLYPLVKPKLLKACAECIQADNVVTLEQLEMLRLIAALLECPMPAMEISDVSL